jgi:hypothetical protein
MQAAVDVEKFKSLEERRAEQKIRMGNNPHAGESK